MYKSLWLFLLISYEPAGVVDIPSMQPSFLFSICVNKYFLSVCTMCDVE